MNKARNKYWSALRNLLRTQSFSARADKARAGHPGAAAGPGRVRRGRLEGALEQPQGSVPSHH